MLKCVSGCICLVVQLMRVRWCGQKQTGLCEPANKPWGQCRYDLIADWIWIVVIKLQELVSFQGSKYTGCLVVFGIPGVSCIADRVLYAGRVAAL